jgi:GGDEF domain-containing protein
MPQGENIPMMIVTGSDDRESIDEGFQAGATQYKTKPVNWSLLGRDVQYILRASNAFNSLKRQEDRLRYLAYFDPLTNLPNRRSFNEQLNRILKRAQRHHKLAALLFIDLDNFKRINDSIGHGRGDRLLVEIEAPHQRIARRRRHQLFQRLQRRGRADDGHGDRPARRRRVHRGARDVDTPEDVERIARRIMTRCRNRSRCIRITRWSPSIGIAMYPQDGRTRTACCATRTRRCTLPSPTAAPVFASTTRR